MKKKLQLNKETMAVLNMSEMSRVVGQAAGECPAENGEYVVFLPHEEDCGMFYKCDWGTPVLMQCPDGLHFNPTLNVCDYPPTESVVVCQSTYCPVTDAICNNPTVPSKYCPSVLVCL